MALTKEKNICTSLAVFKPSEILDFEIKKVEREWGKDKLAKLQQLNIFENATAGKFEVVKNCLTSEIQLKINDSLLNKEYYVEWLCENKTEKQLERLKNKTEKLLLVAKVDCNYDWFVNKSYGLSNKEIKIMEGK